MSDDGSSILMSCLILVLLLLAAAYFAVCETAFASCSRTRLKVLADRGDRRASRALKITESMDRAISTILIGTNIVHLAAASYVTVLVTRHWGVSAVTLSTVITTVVVFFVGEMLPKSLGKKCSEQVCLSCGASLRFFMTAFFPISAALTAIGNLAAKLTRGDSEVSVTEDELSDLIDDLTDEGTLDEERGELVQSALTFGDQTAETIVTSRLDTVSLDVSAPNASIVETIRRCRHSRLPVYEGSIDNIIGILQIRRFIKAYLQDPEVDIRSLLDEPYFVHASTKIDELLSSMSSRRSNIAVVTDNYGGTLGIITVEDILEELVGEIWDEEDVVVEPYRRNKDGSFTFLASVNVEDAFSFMDWEDPSDRNFEHITLSQWAYEMLPFLPTGGENFSYQNLRVTVLSVRKRRIERIRIEILPSGQAEEGEEK